MAPEGKKRLAPSGRHRFGRARRPPVLRASSRRRRRSRQLGAGKRVKARPSPRRITSGEKKSDCVWLPCMTTSLFTFTRILTNDFCYVQEDLWLSAFPVGTEWENIDKVKEFNWSFENLEVDCPFPPSDKIGINSVQRENEEIVPMKAMKMAWVPYVPLEDRLSRIDSLKTKIFTLGCTQRRSALKHLKIERVKKFDYCMPYYMPLQPLEDEDDTVISFLYPLEPPIVDEFDWEMDDYEDSADQKVQEGMPEGEKEKFKEFLKEKVRERKRELKQAKEARKKAIDDMDPKMKEAFENIKFYKFYPVKTPDTPDVNNVKARYINRYYRNAHYLM
ncbi:unnamed protein product [Miscanthus lutarioriparius]|uniref:Uncharacterized protein n=1 Tax=Miscanthus lutarioriparius TaxID=422564 RepID=A0A811MV88_9POAL|nr:unnamed protein product [Miscanthus lutarioriparius]